MFASWPSSGFWLIGTVVGVDLMLHGWMTVLVAGAARAGTLQLIEPPPSRSERKEEMTLKR